MNGDALSLNEDTFSINGDAFSFNEDAFGVKGDTFSFNRDAFSINGDAFSFIADAFSINGHARSLNVNSSTIKFNNKKRPVISLCRSLQFLKQTIKQRVAAWEQAFFLKTAGAGHQKWVWHSFAPWQNLSAYRWKEGNLNPDSRDINLYTTGYYLNKKGGDVPPPQKYTHNVRLYLYVQFACLLSLTDYSCV